MRRLVGLLALLLIVFAAYHGITSNRLHEQILRLEWRALQQQFRIEKLERKGKR